MIVFTDEQLQLYDEACRDYPMFRRYEPLAVAVHTLKGKRILCVKFNSGGLRHAAYMHYTGEGLSEHEMEVITRLHGHDTATAFHQDSLVTPRLQVGNQHQRRYMVRESHVKSE